MGAPLNLNRPKFPGFHILFKCYVKEVAFKQVVVAYLKVAVLYNAFKFSYNRR